MMGQNLLGYPPSHKVRASNVSKLKGIPGWKSLGQCDQAQQRRKMMQAMTHPRLPPLSHPVTHWFNMDYCSAAAHQCTSNEYTQLKHHLCALPEERSEKPT